MPGFGYDEEDDDGLGGVAPPQTDANANPQEGGGPSKMDKAANTVSQIFDPLGLLFPGDRGKGKKPGPTIGPGGRAMADKRQDQLYFTGDTALRAGIAGSAANRNAALDNRAAAERNMHMGISALGPSLAIGNRMAQDTEAQAGANAALVAGTGQRTADDVRNAGVIGNMALNHMTMEGRGGILDAAARPQSSLAEAQLAGAQARAEQNTLSSAAGMSRGGNSALAQRQALNSLATQNTADASALAQLRAQEEASIRNSQIQAAQAAGNLGMTGAQSIASNALGAQLGAGNLETGAVKDAGSLYNQGMTAAGNINQGVSEVGAGVLNSGLSGMNTATMAANDASRNLITGAGQGLNTYTDIGKGQANLDMGVAATGAAEKNAKDAQNTALLGQLLSALI